MGFAVNHTRDLAMCWSIQTSPNRLTSDGPQSAQAGVMQIEPRFVAQTISKSKIMQPGPSPVASQHHVLFSLNLLSSQVPYIR